MADEKDPIEGYLRTKQAAQTARKEHEMSLWQTWKSNGQQPEHLAPLLKLYDPVINSKVRQYKAPNVPESAFKAELQNHLIKAFESYDPSKGAALNTHVDIRLKHGQRYNQRYQNMAYLPAGVTEQISPVRKAEDELAEELGRKPTAQEIAQHLGGRYTTKKVQRLKSSLKRDVPSSEYGKKFPNSSDPGMYEGAYEDQAIEMAKDLLPHLFPNKPDMHTLFNYTFGVNGHPKVTSTTELSKKMGKNPSQISRMKTQMGNTLRKQMGFDREEQ